MIKREYDFTNWKSHPSSIKLTSDLPDWWFPDPIAEVGVIPGSELTSKIFAKQVNVTQARQSGVIIHGYDGTKWKYIEADIVVSYGDLPEWTLLERTITIPPDITKIYLRPGIGSTLGPEAPATVWYDNLEIYQNGVLIYENKFSNWGPTLIGGGIIAAILAAIFGVGRKRKK